MRIGCKRLTAALLLACAAGLPARQPPAWNAAGGLPWAGARQALAQQAPGAAERLDAATAGDREHVAEQLANVARLLERSSGARRVAASDNELARKIHRHAWERHAAAQRAFQAGDSGEAQRLLSEATLTMVQAVRMLGPTSETARKQADDFERRAESARVLLEALQRIAREEDSQGDAARTVETVERTVSAARIYLANGDPEHARRLLDSAYEIAKAAVEQLRDGKTLVRTLRFENAEHEYRYEVDRNDTHHMLVRVLVQEKRPGPQAQAAVEDLVQRAGVLRREAEAKAGGGNFRAAIELLEQSTRELVRAIRGAGLYIPG